MSICAHTPVSTAEIWKKKFLIFLKASLSFNRMTYLLFRLCLNISFILFLFHKRTARSVLVGWKTKKCTLPCPLLHFSSSLFTQNVLWETKEMAFPRPSIKNILGNMRSDSLFWSAFRALAFLPVCTPSKSLAMPLHAPKTIFWRRSKGPKDSYNSLVI